MKKILSIIIMAFVLFAANVYAANDKTINIEIRNGRIEVTDFESQDTITNYSDYLTYSNNALVLKKGTIVNVIFTDTDLTLTSNDEYVQIRGIEGEKRDGKYPNLNVDSLKTKNIKSEDRGLVICDFKETYIKASTIENFYQLTTEQDNAIININYSTIIGDSFYSEISTTGYSRNVDIRIIDSTIKVGSIGNYTEDGLHEVIRDNDTPDMVMVYANITIMDEINCDSTMNILNSVINGNGSMIVADNFNIEESYINLTASNQYATLVVGNKATISNSTILLENEGTGVAFGSYSGEVEFVNGGVPTTKYGAIVTMDDYSTPLYAFVMENHDPAKTFTISSEVTITFRVKNGTWANGSTNDIVYTKRTYDKLNESEIPTGMIAADGAINGSWNQIPQAGSYVTRSVVYEYSYIKAKADKNPATGVFNYTFVIVIGMAIGLAFYKKYKNKTLFK